MKCVSFESWVPLWDDNTTPGGVDWHSVAYQNYSMQLVAKAHPDWSADKVEKQAKTEFEAAATAMFVAALNHATALRSKAKWGFCAKLSPHICV